MRPDLGPRRWRAVVFVLSMVTVAVVAGAVGAIAADQFSDVPDDHPFHDEISWMADASISEGYSDGTFRPDTDVTRQAMAAFMQRLAGHDPEVDPVVDAATVEGETPADLKTVSGHEIESVTSDFNQDPEKSVTAVCPDGKQAIGGGGSIFPSLGDDDRDTAPIALVRSYPSTSQNGWVVRAREMATYTHSWDLTVRVVCVAGEGGS